MAESDMRSAKDLIAEMSIDLGMLREHLLSIIKTAPLRYKVFYIEKRSGGLREVAQPAREIKAIQRWIVRELEPLLPLHSAATAYHRGASIKQHAIRHADSNFLLKMDFRDFFPSIVASDIALHLEAHCGGIYEASAIKLIAYVCTWAPMRQGPLRLCVGAPSSPMLSNSVMYDFDSRVATLSKKYGVTYSRYADDLAFSSTKSGVLKRYPGIIAKVAKEARYPRLQVNEEKTVFASRAGRRVLTGLVLTPDRQVSIGRERKRLIRAMYHRHTLARLSDEEEYVLNGMLAFADSVEPGFSGRLGKRSAG